MRQLIQVEVNGNEQRRIQSQLRNTYYRSLLPVIDKICSELSTPDQLHRIDRLEIELGEIPADNIDSTLTRSFTATLKKQLAAAISNAPEVNANLELFDFFIHHGSLPWWVDSGEANPLSTRLETLIRDNPQDLRQLLRNIPESSQVWRRIVRAYPDALLDKLIGVLAPEVWTGNKAATDSDAGASWLTLLREAGAAKRQSIVALKRAFWEQALHAASIHGKTPVFSTAASSAVDFHRAILKRLARRIKQDYPALVVALQRAVNTATIKINPWVKQVVTVLIRTQKETQKDSSIATNKQRLESTEVESELLRDSSTTNKQRLEREDEKPERSNDATNHLITLLNDVANIRSQLENKPAPTGNTWLELLKQLRRAVKQLPAGHSKTKLLNWLNATQEISGSGSTTITGAETSAANRPFESAADRDQLVGMVRELLSQYETKKTNTEKANTEKEGNINRQQSTVDSSFSETDALYINNAGLVILWPFLPRFFQHLQLLTDNKQFASETAQQRAIGLLQYLVNADESPQEFPLPLNKVLCGMAPDDIFDFEAEINAEEKAACDDFLTAVIQQAPVLKNMSINGFRGSFLLRQGQLIILDDHWLLRAERETHDIVLDRFPWTFNIVKLPWMQAVMQVEW